MSVRRILVVGAGVAGAMAAAVLARTARGRIAVTLAQVGPAPAGALAALPELRQLHARLGVTDAALAAAGAALPKLGLRLGQAIAPFGQTGATLDGVAFHHLWRRAGAPAPLSDWSLSARAARRGRFAPPSADPASPLSTLDYGYVLDAPRYAALLGDVAVQAGATTVDGALAKVETGPDGIAAVVLADGRRLQADLFVDATAHGRLISALGEAWRAWDDVPALRPVADADLLTAFAPDPEGARPGRRARTFVGDCAAIGPAAGVSGGADGGELRVLQACVTHLAALIPAGDGAAGRAEFDRLTALALEAAHDMAVLRWGDLAAASDTLALRRDAFAGRGRVILLDEDAWPAEGWTHAFLARGVVPARWDPLAERIGLDHTTQMLGRMKTVLEQTAEGMPRWGRGAAPSQAGIA